MNDDRPLDNARLVQFRVYNTKKQLFRDALARFDGDLAAFVAASRTLDERRKREKKAFDPWKALEELSPPG